MRAQLALLTLVFLTSGCAPEGDADGPAQSSEPSWAAEWCSLPRTDCSACLNLDDADVGRCKLDLRAATPAEIVSILRWSVSGRDRWAAWNDEVALGHAFMVQKLALEGAFDEPDGGLSLERVKEAVTMPDRYGYGGLRGLEVRVNGGSRKDTGTCWGGLEDFVATHKPDLPAPDSCCVGAGCAGADHRCAETGPGDLLRVCEPL